jgi:tetratricopeptide (TPR) repeat protein
MARKIILFIVVISVVACTITVLHYIYFDINHTKTLPKDHYLAGIKYLEAKRYKLAIAELKMSIVNSSDNYDALVLLAVAHAKIRHPGAALRAFKEAEKTEPGSLKAYVVFAQALSETGQKDMAITLLEKAIKIDPENAQVSKLLDAIYAEKGSLELSLLKTTILETRMNAVSDLARMGRYAEAISECKKALEIDPKSIAIRNNLGVLYSMAGDDDEAISQINEIVKQSPRESSAYKNIAIIYSKYPQKSAMAIEYFEKYLASRADAPDRELVQQKITELRR